MNEHNRQMAMIKKEEQMINKEEHMKMEERKEMKVKRDVEIAETLNNRYQKMKDNYDYETIADMLSPVYHMLSQKGIVGRAEVSVH